LSTSAFLISLGQCLATMNLYADGHPARERALDASFERLQELQAAGGPLEFSFVGGETIVGQLPVPELASWDWGARLAGVGVERIEIAGPVSREMYDRFLDEVWRRVTGRPDATAEARQLAPQAIRWGPLAVRRSAAAGAEAAPAEGAAVREGAAFDLSLSDEVATVRWLHDEVALRESLQMVEVDAVVQSLSLAMRSERRMVLPLLDLKRFDQYTTTHACNVSVLAMALAERMGLGRREVRSFGVAGLLHDIGKTRIPHEILVKPGKLTEAERHVMQQHPMEGARIVLEQERGLGLAAVVAYEHHVCIDGTGYPHFHFARQCHLSSRIVHVCDIYDALCSNRPYREGWDSERALTYLESRAGTEVDATIVRTFVAMVRGSTTHRMPMPEAPGVPA
jgi:putative nucleotidyltransferase with HDIG domain